MRQLRLLVGALAFFGLGGSAFAQYMPYPQYPANYYPAPAYYNPNNPPLRPMPAYVPVSYAPPVYYGPPPLPPQPYVRPLPDPAPVPEIVVNPPCNDPPAKTGPKSMAQFLAAFGPRPDPGLPTGPRGAVPTASGDAYIRPGLICLKDYFTKEAVPAKCFWFQGETLLWTVKGSGPNFPLVTTDTNPGTPLSGSLASPTAIPLFGQEGFQYPSLSGGRLTLGFWLDCNQRLGLEASGFALQRRSVGFSAGSDTTGNPPLYIPAFNTVLNREDRLVVSDPAVPFVGGVSLSSTLQLWGADVNGVFNVTRGDCWRFDCLAGLRYFDLNEVFLLQNTTTGLVTQTSITDHFQVHNQFAGAQVGARLEFSWCRLMGGVTAKLAAGSTLQTIDINGATAQNGATAGRAPGGFFAQPSNSGVHGRDVFSVVPQIGVMLGYNLTPRLSVFGGYDALYWTQVARAGEQIDRSLNLTQSSTFGTGNLVGTARPQFSGISSDFWAHGASFGVQLRY